MDCSLPSSSVHGLLQAKNTGVGCHFLLQEIFLTQGLKPSLLNLLHWQVDSLPLCHLGSPGRYWINISFMSWEEEVELYQPGWKILTLSLTPFTALNNPFPLWAFPTQAAGPPCSTVLWLHDCCVAKAHSQGQLGGVQWSVEGRLRGRCTGTHLLSWLELCSSILPPWNYLMHQGQASGTTNQFKQKLWGRYPWTPVT